MGRVDRAIRRQPVCRISLMRHKPSHRSDRQRIDVTELAIGLGGRIAILVPLGVLIGLADRRRFTVRWLVVAAFLVAINAFLLTGGYGWIPDVVGGEWDWQSKLFALCTTLAIAILPAFGWRRSGLTLKQEPGSIKAAVPVCLLYCAVFVAFAVAFPSGKVGVEEVAFQLTMPGLEEEPFYRGILLLGLDRAFTGRKRFLGVEWGWGAVISCFLFGMAHAFGFSDGHFMFDWMIMALTALPSFIIVWLRIRTGSVLLPILLHNFGNSFSLIV